MRKKFVFCIALLTICILSVFAATTDTETFYKQLPGMFMVNLKSTSYPSHVSNATWGGSSGSGSYYYYDNQLIGVFGIRNPSDDVTFTVTLEGTVKDWVYLLDTSDASISRPFGLDLIVKGRPDYYVDVSSLIESSTGSGNVIHMGYQTANGGEIIMPTSCSATFKISKTAFATYDNVIWMDIALVLPELTNDAYTYNEKTFTAKSSTTPYTAKLTIKVDSGDFHDTVTLDLSGMYSNTASTEDYSAVMLVTPNAASKSLDIASMAKSDNSVVHVADFSFATTSTELTEDNKTACAYIFLSSSSDGSTAGEKFKLRRVRSDGSYSDVDSKYNSITYVAILKSTVSNRTTEKTFDGTTCTRSGTDYFYSVSGVEMTDHKNTAQWIRWYDDGQIQIKIAADSSEDYTQLTAGKYTSTIYVHVETL